MNYFDKLNDKQKEAVVTLDGPVLVLAGAGSGKTRVVTTRIIHLIASKVPAWKILGLTFTNKAASEMKERVLQLAQNDVLIATFHSLGARILRESIEVLGYNRDFSIYDQNDSEKLLAGCLEKMGIKEKKTLRTWVGLISKAKNDLTSVEAAAEREVPDEYQTLFPVIYRQYLEQLKTCNAVDFDDLLFLPVQLFRNHPGVLERYQQRWSHLLVDEYQDTNAAQYNFLKLLMQKSGNLFVVGDPDQSIYSWRGANIHNIMQFERDYPGAQVIRLEKNYRSGTTILEAANAVIKNNSNRYEKSLYSDRGEGAKIGNLKAMTERDEARLVAAKIRSLHNDKGIPYSEMVIFYRTNAQSRPFEDLFMTMHTPFKIVGGVSFYQRKEIKDILAYLRLFVTDCDAIAFERVINLPKRGIGPSTVEKLIDAAMASGLPVVEYCRRLLAGEPLQFQVKLTKTAANGLHEFVSLIDMLRGFKDSIEELINLTLEKTNYFLILKEEPETYSDRKENIGELLKKANEWESTAETPTLATFLDELALTTNLDEAVGDDHISLMTVHNGKGLEFTAAFLVGLEEDLFPHANSRDNDQALEEERRLFYVGMTRAKDYLFLSQAEMRYLWGFTRFQRPSRFLKEIPAQYMESDKVRVQRY